ncbi:FAD-binding domain-containing protein [Rhodospirillum centenum]|uniref:Cryptochrome/DNA photolyase FAD-binding domain-containing protein n=1 Tax=Rhodospirillum centenum (strain ATCC 51521 / SW) TaxID=414684 RepID=B6IPR5_RHOCS|nr:FAD-binding domain-containing protein [Rhodospirillum centenum]ACI99767.1 conserved hypothetical protein [Rhodospirillum centenum SW]
MEKALARPRQLTLRIGPAGGDGRYCVVEMIGEDLRKAGMASADAAALGSTGRILDATDILRMTQPFPPRRDAGLARLHAFLPRAGQRYAAERNHDRGPADRGNVSGLGPYVRHRLVTEAEVIRHVLDVHSFGAAEKFIQEQFWRTYWKGWLELRPQVWRDWLAGVAEARRRLDRDPGLHDCYTDAVAGRTGIDGFDAWAAELRETGYLHNHARMWFASIWIFTLRLPWELGAEFFLRHLLDGDPASNTLSWRWVGGLQTVGKTYLARRDNIRTYTEGRFDPVGLATSAAPLTGTPIPPPGTLPALPVADPTVRTGLLLHEDDLAPESLAGVPPLAAVAVLDTAPVHSPHGVSERVQTWVSGALADAAQRAGKAFGLTPDRLTGTDWCARMIDWARAAGLAQVVAPYAPVGPTADRLAALETALGDAGIQLVRLPRPYDRASWPHATRGYFAFKEKIPRLLTKAWREPGLCDSIGHAEETDGAAD